MENEPSPEAVTAWARLVRAAQRTMAAIEADLKAAGLPPLGWYDVLLELVRADQPLRPVALEQKLLLAQHNVSRLLDRMEAAGLVARAPCEEDGRGQVVSVTDAGRAMQKRMWAVYGPAIRRHVGDRIGGDASALAELLRRLT